ncbi:hypothetical protein NDU88_003763 [Pleurodeles waltl]|uniref:Uncharacterized protein n=1 Tax=Pleurodeles waltl TaxID=8319 RepID=A0AAV7LMH4_PLEWA|nr:hypothetical protein NDU88_003763 [Pleurodeles waltl]
MRRSRRESSRRSIVVTGLATQFPSYYEQPPRASWVTADNGAEIMRAIITSSGDGRAGPRTLQLHTCGAAGHDTYTLRLPEPAPVFHSTRILPRCPHADRCSPYTAAKWNQAFQRSIICVDKQSTRQQRKV